MRVAQYTNPPATDELASHCHERPQNYKMKENG